jgi:hypothetical protein
VVLFEVQSSFGVGTIFSLLAFNYVFFAIDIRDKRLAEYLRRFSTRRAYFGVARLAELEIIWLRRDAASITFMNWHALQFG